MALRPALITTLLVLGAGCAATMKAAGYPPEALRKTPPPELLATALEVGVEAPSLPQVGEHEGPVVLVFYRGHW